MVFLPLGPDDLKLHTAPMWSFHSSDWQWNPTLIRDYCLWYVSGGTGEVYCDQTFYPLSQGTLIVWRPDEMPIVERNSVRVLRLFTCHFECSALPVSWFDLPRPLNIAYQNYFVGLAHRCEELWWRDTDDSKFEAQRNFLSILYLIGEEANSTFSVDDDDMDSVESVLKGHFARPWTLDEIAEIAWLSRSQLVRRFRGRYGQSPLQFLNLTRLENARRMLIETDWSLEKIATECGFHDGAHFSNAFKKQFGVAPRTLRKR